MESESSWGVLMGLTTLGIGFLGMFLSVHRMNIPMYVDTAFTAMPFFVCGYYLNKKTNVLQLNRYDKYSYLIMAVCFLLTWYFAGNYTFRRNIIGDTYTLFSLYPCGLLGSLGILYLSKCFKKLPFLSYVGKYSIMILVTHKFLYQAYKPLIALTGLHHGKAALLNFVITILSYLIIIPLLKKFLPHVTAQKDVIKAS